MCWYWTGHVSDKFGLIFLWRNKNLPLLAQPLNDVHAAASVTAAAKLLQSCLTLCDLIDGSLTGFSIPGILQARTLEWVDISFSNAWKWKVNVKSVVSDSLRPHGLQPTRFLRPWDLPGRSPPCWGLSYYLELTLLQLQPICQLSKLKKWV